MPGVSVVLKETQRGTTTVADGTFSLDIADQGPSVLVFSFVGYQRQEVTVGNQTNLSVSLVPESSTLSEVVVTALGIPWEKRSGVCRYRSERSRINASARKQRSECIDR